MIYLSQNNINVTIRREFGGAKVDAACGQLRAKNERGSEIMQTFYMTDAGKVRDT